MTLVMSPKSVARSVALRLGRCFSSSFGIVFVQIAPAARRRNSQSKFAPGERRERRTNGAADRATNLSPEEDDGGDHCDVDVGHGRLRANLGAHGRETTADALEELRPDDLRIGGVGATRVDHEADTEKTDSETDGEDPLLRETWMSTPLRGTG